MYIKFFKRLTDILFAFIGLLISFIPLLIISVVIMIETKEKPFFVQQRTGKDGKVFKLYKLRTMKEDDKTVTRVGKFLRKFSIDELPQFFNVLRGEMSFIGPRPWIPEYYALFTEEEKKRVSVLPGLSGLAQISGRNELSVFDKIDFDLKYVENISFITDLKIFFKTFVSVFSTKGHNATEDDIHDELRQLEERNLKLEHTKKEVALKI